MQQPQPRRADFNWDLLGMNQHKLSSLDSTFSEAEIKEAVHKMLSDRAPGPDGYTRLFLKSC